MTRELIREHMRLVIWVADSSRWIRRAVMERIAGWSIWYVAALGCLMVAHGQIYASVQRRELLLEWSMCREKWGSQLCTLMSGTSRHMSPGSGTVVRFSHTSFVWRIEGVLSLCKS